MPAKKNVTENFGDFSMETLCPRTTTSEYSFEFHSKNLAGRLDFHGLVDLRRSIVARSLMAKKNGQPMLETHNDKYYCCGSSFGVYCMVAN